LGWEGLLDRPSSLRTKRRTLPKVRTAANPFFRVSTVPLSPRLTPWVLRFLGKSRRKGRCAGWSADQTDRMAFRSWSWSSMKSWSDSAMNR